MVYPSIISALNAALKSSISYLMSGSHFKKLSEKPKVNIGDRFLVLRLLLVITFNDHWFYRHIFSLICCAYTFFIRLSIFARNLFK